MRLMMINKTAIGVFLSLFVRDCAIINDKNDYMHPNAFAKIHQAFIVPQQDT